MASFYNKVVKNLNTSKIVVFQSQSNSTIVLSVLVANTTGSTNSDVTIEQDSSSDVLEAYLARQITIPSQSNIDIISNKYILPSGKKLALFSSSSGTLDALVSYVEV